MNLNGLTSDQVTASRNRFGANELPANKQVSKLQILLQQFRSPLVFILFAAAMLTVILGEYVDAAAIVIIVAVNALLGFVQENRAQRALEALKSMIKPQVRAIRNGQEQIITADQIVVGDLIKLKLGERVPADGVLLQTTSFSSDEAVLTGESAAVEKSEIVDAESFHAGNFDPSAETFKQIPIEHKVFMGTVVLTGYGVMQVRAIGLQTEFGSIARTLSAADHEQTPLQRRLAKFSKQIAIIVALLAALVFVIGFFIADPETYTHGLNTGMLVHSTSERLAALIALCVSLAVSAIPEGLVIGLTVVLTLSMQRLLRRKALVRKLVVAETLGSVSTICVDKTGTITEGRMRMIGTEFSDDALAQQALHAVNQDVNAVDAAVGEWLRSQNSPAESLDLGEHVFDIPFDSVHKFTASAYSQALFVAGAPEILLAASDLTPERQQEWQLKIDTQAELGHRIIAVGYRKTGSKAELPDPKSAPQTILQGLSWLGILTLEDPVRADVASAFELLNSAGINIKVITGDQQRTAVNVMQQAGISVAENEMLSGAELAELSDAELQQLLPDIHLFYRTVPEQKLRIVELLKANGEVVAMMGDGINDAPALKRADVGVAVENATEVSKETADIVLLENNMHTIVAAVAEGRTVFENMRKVITYLLSDSFAEVLLIIGSLLMGLPLPLIPLQILFINLIADGFPDLALGFEKAERDVMRDKPRKLSAGLLDREMVTLIAIIGVVVNLFIFAIYLLMLQAGTEVTHARSFIFFLLTVDSLLYVFSIRSLRHNIWSQNPFSNWVLNGAVIFGFILTGLAFYFPITVTALELTPLSGAEVGLVVVISAVKILIIELVKYIFIVREQN